MAKRKNKLEKFLQSNATVLVIAALVLVGGLVVVNSAKAQIADWFGKVSVEIGLSPELNELLKDTQPEPVLGGFPGPDITENRVCIGGVCKWYFKQALHNSGTGSTTVCSLRPRGATTTPIAWYMQLDVATSSQLNIEFALDDTYNGTSTSIGLYNLAASTKGTLRATSSIAFEGTSGGATTWSANHEVTHLIVEPDRYYNINIGGGPEATNVFPTGHCYLEALEF